MEILSKLLKSKFVTKEIAYHPKTSVSELSHLMFADDLMVFFNGSASSLHSITETLEDFAGWSGLSLNPDKSTIFFAGLSTPDSSALSAYGFKKGTFPIRYLGLPLMHRKLRLVDCEPLFFSLSKTFRGWAAKTLSYAGRVQLLSSVISGIVNFWISTFMLPLNCIKKIEQLCSRFLWASSIDSSNRAKVSWQQVCLPKEEGGLGLRRFALWNKTLCLRFIWTLFSSTPSLWAGWHKHHSLRGQCFWSLKINTKQSWTWKALLRLRPLASRFIKGIFGNGSLLSFWYDNWTPMGPLIELLGEAGPAQLGIPLLAPVACATNGAAWNLLSPRSEEALALHAYLTTLNLPPQPGSLDSYAWYVDNVRCQGFSSSKTWESCRLSQPVKSWAKLIWFKGSIPRNAFTMWLANLDRLPLRVRLHSWGLNIPLSCCFCSSFDESRDHLFFQCHYSSSIWNIILSNSGCRMNAPSNWSELLSWMHRRSSCYPSTLRKLAGHSIIKHLWFQRNEVLHNNILAPAPQTAKQIYREVKLTITARHHRPKFRRLMSFWIR